MAPNENTRLVSDGQTQISFTLLTCFCFVFAHAALLGFNLGLPTSMVVSVQQVFSLNSWYVGWLIAIGNLATALSSVIGAALADSFGRWALSGLAIVMSFLGSIALASAQGYTQLLIGRSLHGVHIGFSMVAIALYTAEATPRQLRGRFGTASEIFINVGLLSTVVGALILTQWLEFTVDQDWRFLTWMSAGLAFLLLPALLLLRETPRWYAMQSRWDEAKSTLLQMVSDPEEVRVAIVQLRDDVRASLSDKKPACTQLGALFCCEPKLRKPLLRAQGIAFFHHFTGIVVPSFFSILLLQDRYGKSRAQIGAVIIFAFKLAAIIVSTVLVDRAGRRPLLLASSLIMACGYFLWAAAGNFVLTSVALVICAIGFSVGIGPLNYVIPGEVLPLSIRAWGIAACNVTCRVTEAGVSLAILPAMDAFGLVPCVLVLGGNCLIALIFFWLVMPENMHVSVETSSSQA